MLVKESIPHLTFITVRCGNKGRCGHRIINVAEAREVRNDAFGGIEVKIFRLDLQDGVPSVNIERGIGAGGIAIGHANDRGVSLIVLQPGVTDVPSVGSTAEDQTGGYISAVQGQRNVCGVNAGRRTDREDQLVRWLEEKLAIRIHVADAGQIWIGRHEHVEVRVGPAAGRRAHRVLTGQVDDRQSAVFEQGHPLKSTASREGELAKIGKRLARSRGALPAGDFVEGNRRTAGGGQAGIYIIVARRERLGVILPLGARPVADHVVRDIITAKSRRRRQFGRSQRRLRL